MTFSISGGLIIAIGGQMAALAIGLIGAKAMEAIGRNPEASGKIRAHRGRSRRSCRSNPRGSDDEKERVG